MFQACRAVKAYPSIEAYRLVSGDDSSVDTWMFVLCAHQDSLDGLLLFCVKTKLSTIIVDH